MALFARVLYIVTAMAWGWAAFAWLPTEPIMAFMNFGLAMLYVALAVLNIHPFEERDS